MKRGRGCVSLPFVRCPEATTNSILLRQKNRSRRAVRFGDDPDFGAVLEVVGRENPEAFLQRELVLAAIVFVQVTPVTVNLLGSPEGRAVFQRDGGVASFARLRTGVSVR